MIILNWKGVKKQLKKIILKTVYERLSNKI